MYVEQLAGNAIGSLDDNFVIVEWTAEIGEHWLYCFPHDLFLEY